MGSIRGLSELAALGIKFTVETQLCLTWARIAIDAASRAFEHHQTGAHDPEFGESLLACTAAAHAIDAFYGGFQRFVDRPAQVTDKTARNAQIVERARAAFDIGPAAKDIADHLQWLYRLRDKAVHFGEEPHPPRQHPSGDLVAEEVVLWSAPEAHRAVTYMLDFMARCVVRPRPGVDGLGRWAQSVEWIVNAMATEWVGRGGSQGETMES